MVVEVANHLGGVVNRRVIESVLSESREVLRRHLLSTTRKLSRELTERPISGRERRASPIAGHRMYVRVGVGVCLEGALDLFPEVMRVRLRSVEAVELRRSDRCEQLTLCTRQWGRSLHERRVEAHARVHHGRIDAHDVHDVPNATGTGHRRVQEALQETSRFRDRAWAPLLVVDQGLVDQGA